MSFFIRTAMKQDIPAIRALLVETWHNTYDRSMGSERVDEICDNWHSNAALEERLKAHKSEFLVADNGEELGGMAFATGKEKRITLHQLYILPQFQGQKIGSDLLGEIENCFPDCNHIGLEVGEDNQQAIDFYTSQGFAMTGKSAHCMEEGSDIPSLLMEKPIVYLD